MEHFNRKWNNQTFGQFLYSLIPEKKIKKINKSTLLVLFNETCIKEELLHKYTTIYKKK